MSFSFSYAVLVHSFSNIGCQRTDVLLDLPFVFGKNFCIYMGTCPLQQNEQNLMDSVSLSCTSCCIVLFASLWCLHSRKESCTQDKLSDFLLDLCWHLVSLICRMKSKNRPTQKSDVSYMSGILAYRILRAMQPARSLLRWTDDLHKIFVEAVARQGGPYGLVSRTLSI